jgi:alkylhydroperoxidase family enzyme
MAEPRTRYRELVTLTTHAVLDGRGVTASQMRWAAFHRRIDELPAELRNYVQTVAANAWRVTDEDVNALKRAGHSEDAIFEVTAAAALGAAIMRMERGLIVLEESRA